MFSMLKKDRAPFTKRRTSGIVAGVALILGVAAAVFYGPSQNGSERKADPSAYLSRLGGEPKTTPGNLMTSAPLPESVAPPESKPVIATASAQPAASSMPALEKRPQERHTRIASPAKKQLPAASSKAKAEEEWNRWGVAPYAPTQAQACRKAPVAIDGFLMPTPVKEHFKQKLGSSCEGGTVVWLTPHQRLEAMWSGGAKPRVMQNVTVAELPVLTSPDGRPYRKGAVAETAKALSWAYVYEGKTYVLYLPLVCFNWSWALAPTIAPVAREECVEITFFRAPVGGHVRWGVGTRTGPLPPDACNAQRQGDESWTAWYGECDVCVPALGLIGRFLGGSAQVPHKYLYPVTHEKQTLRFSKAIWQDVVYICLEFQDRTDTCGVYMRPQDWKGRHRVELPDELWRKNDGNCPS